ncbi:hypothetical protein BGC_04530 [Burkholderia sp. 3C]
MPFAFPFLRKRRSEAKAPERFTDEHEIHRLLAECESGGAYLVSRKGMWHGGIHVTEAGAGERLDLDAGVRCIADGELIAFRADKAYPLSTLTSGDSESPAHAAYSTGFALVRHTMTFPRDSTLTFYSLYMHLMSDEDYANFPERNKPSYWLRQWRVTEYAWDTPSRRRNGPRTDASQQGLRVRRVPNGASIGIVPQGAILILGKRKTVHRHRWAQVEDLPGAVLYPAEAGGYVEPACAIGGWVYLGEENGGAVIEASVADSTFDRVVVAIDPESKCGIPIRAGDPVGHLGRYDSLTQCTGATRMVHVEVFCGEDIESFIEQGCAWVNRYGPHREDWAELGLPADPALLRIGPGTVLYRQTGDGKFIPGADPLLNKTDAVQAYAIAQLARDPARRIPEPHPHPDPGFPVNWWHVDGVNALEHPIDGWVRDFNFPGGRVTREFPQKWVDFQCLSDAHDSSHTIFANPQAWFDYASQAGVADPAAQSKLSPLMRQVHDALFAKGDGMRAADALCQLTRMEHAGYPWGARAASRLIVRHESEWANPSKWAPLINVLEQETGSRRQHEEELARIEKLVWWDEVRAGVKGFPDSNVFHLHPIGLVGNFVRPCDCFDKFKKISRIILRHEGGYSNQASDKGGATNHGIAWRTWQAFAMEDLGIEPTVDNLKSLTAEQAEEIYFKRYWQARGFCGLDDMSVALMIYDWTITSGGAVKEIQKILNEKYDSKLKIDGGMGEETISALNDVSSQEVLLQDVAEIRRRYYENLVRNDLSQKVYLRGWINRVEDCLAADI